MKIKYFAFLMFSMIITGCSQVGSVNDIEPEYVLTEDNVFADALTTEAFANGMYTQWRSNGITQMRNAMFLLTRTTCNTNVARAYEFKINDVSPQSPLIENYYKSLYLLMNQANTIISMLPTENPKNLSAERKTEIIGEAYFNRGVATFMLLRMFGEFWDINSSYGVVLYDTPVTSNDGKIRASVKECYEQIQSDLDKAAKMAPNFNCSYRASRISAKAFSAKVAMYLNDFKKANDLAQDVLKECKQIGLVLESNYSDVFVNGYESTEMLFAIRTEYPEETISTGIFNDFYFNGTDGTNIERIGDDLVGEYEDGDLITGENMDPRYKDIIVYTDEGLMMSKYLNNIDGEDVNPYYVLRLPEVYLIRAEALARLGLKDDSRAMLKEITDRAGYDVNYVYDSIEDSELLLKILQHKFIELYAENYEEWFDMVRYNLIDGIDFVNKRYLRAFNHKCLPIPYAAIAGNGSLSQNPEYVHN